MARYSRSWDGVMRANFSVSIRLDREQVARLMRHADRRGFAPNQAGIYKLLEDALWSLVVRAQDEENEEERNDDGL